MTNQSDVARGREIIERWCVLAEQRLDYLTELFETGRWRRFYSEISFLENIREAKTAVETWRLLLNQQGAADNSAVDMSWLDRRKAKALPPRRASFLRYELRPPLPRFFQLAVDRPAEPAAEPPSKEAPLRPAEVAASADDKLWQRSLDLAGMQQRYPLLRNTL